MPDKLPSRYRAVSKASVGPVRVRACSVLGLIANRLREEIPMSANAAALEVAFAAVSPQLWYGSSAPW